MSQLPSFANHSAILPILASSTGAYLIFKQYEPEKPLPVAILLGLVPGLLVSYIRTHFHSLLGAILSTYLSYWTLIVIFTITYRISPLHPLSRYPGPLACKISKGWHAYVVASSGKAHLYVHELHKQYGEIVRIGPNELSITHEDFTTAVLGPKGLPRGPYYNTRKHDAGTSLDGLRDQAVHSARRRPWARGMNSSNMKYYEELVKSTVSDLLAALRQREGETIDISQWMTFFGFDFMGHMAFTYDYGMLKHGRDNHRLSHLIENALIEAAWISHLPWSISILQYLPGASKSWDEVKAVGEETVRQRIAAGSQQKDLFYHLTDEEGHEPVRPNLELCAADGALAVIAGSDTAATALSHLWCFLLTNPRYLQQLREEVAKAFPSGIDPTTDLAKQITLPYLNACINESLRLLPPVLTGMQRRVESGTGGRMIGPYFVPEGTQVSPSAYAVHHDSQHFSPLPDTFWPDRWLSQDTYVLPNGDPIAKQHVTTNREVFMPFSQGPMVCVGKNVAMTEMRAVVCAVVQHFDLEIAEKSCFDSYEHDIYEIFVTRRGTLPVRLRSRSFDYK